MIFVYPSWMTDMDDRGAPTFELLLDGTPYSVNVLKHLLSLEFAESLEELDALTVQFVVPEESSQVMNLARHGIDFEARLGYGDTKVRHIQGVIVEVSYARSEQTPWVVSLRGLDSLYKLKRTPRSKVWEGDHAAIARAIAAEHQLGTEIAGVDGTSGTVFQDRQDDATFLMKLAKENNYFVRVQDGKLLFKPRSEAYRGDTVTLTWGRDVQAIQVSQNLQDLATSVKAKGWSYEQNQVIERTAGSSVCTHISAGSLGPDLAGLYFGTKETVIEASGKATPSDVYVQAKAMMQKSAETFVKGQVTCFGRPEARSGGRLEIRGTGPVDATYHIRQTRHTIEPGAGYLTQIEFYSDSLPVKDPG